MKLPIKRIVAAVPGGKKNQEIGFQFLQKIVYCVLGDRFLVVFKVKTPTV
jgi:hypothetical protein